MREIKFRGKLLSGEWVYGLLAYTESKKIDAGDTGYFISNDAGMPFAYQVDPKTVGQFTGRTGKDGKEVWEDDIIKFGHHHVSDGKTRTIISVVKFAFSQFCVEIDPGKDSFHLELCEAYPIEIIGNIHDNEDLKEEKNE